MKICAYYPNYFYNAAIPGAAYHIIKGMQSPGNQVELMGMASIVEFNDKFYKNVIPQWAKSIVYKVLPSSVIVRISNWAYCKTVKKNDVVYLWPGVQLAIYQRLKKRGCIIIYECVNTHEAHSKVILDEAYTQLNLPLSHGVTAEKVIEETAKLELADYIFSCSPIMTQSMLNNSIQLHKLLQTSYGLGAESIVDGVYSKVPVPNKIPTFIFVGSISVRKGVHLLLDYWVKAKLNAKLQLIGTIEPAIKNLVEKYLEQDNVEHIPYTNDLASIYKNADVFVLPSLEEGSPLVTYMAFGAGLPLLVSPMGGGGVVTDGEDAVVIDPHDEATWIAQLQHLATDAVFRAKLAHRSKLKAPYYLWDAVAKRRLDLLVNAIKNH